MEVIERKIESICNGDMAHCELNNKRREMYTVEDMGIMHKHIKEEKWSD